MALPPEELALPVAGAAGPALAARAWGPASGRRVLALHGWLDNAATFDLIGPSLGAAGLRVVALDLPGHGLSGHKSADAGYAFVDWAYDVDRAAVALGWDRFCLLGHSLGAAVACLYSGVFPGKIDRIAAIEGLMPLTAPENELPDRLALHFAGRARAAAGAKQAPVYESIERARATRMTMGEFPVGDWIDGVVRRGLAAKGAGFVWRSDPRLRIPSGQRLTPGQAEAVLARIAAPVLLVRARQGIPIPPALFASMQAAVRTLTLVELDGGHHVHLEHPGAVAEAVAGFLGD